MQIGFVGLGRMGGNMVHRIHRDSEHRCVAFDFSDEAVSQAVSHVAPSARGNWSIWKGTSCARCERSRFTSPKAGVWNTTASFHQPSCGIPKM